MGVEILKRKKDIVNIRKREIMNFRAVLIRGIAQLYHFLRVGKALMFLLACNHTNKEIKKHSNQEKKY